MSILSVQKLSKNYRNVRALVDVSFEVPKGSVFGILGPNGSGKTTLLGLVMDVLKATSGNYLWLGQPGSEEQRRQIGTLLETPNFYPYLSAKKNLLIAAEIKRRGAEQLDEILKTVNLYQRRDSKFSTYSLGMKQRLAIASTMIGDPDILVFDEPTNGLDPAGIAEIRELIKQLNRRGKTIIMASHILDEVEKVCTHVAILQKGVLKTVGTVSEVMAGAASTGVVYDIASDDLSSLILIMEKMEGVITVNRIDDYLQLICKSEIKATDINRYCFEKGFVLSQLALKRRSLEKTFLEITGNQSDR